ncbi:juvenile hormone esterase-like [Rhynchophorus ferrugineus]|uniref:juvenile hormone esterase-like n=1 Tax=Rhynchophorus ferrugineus TaxID=354439 RepID=UPI003FCC8BFD
MVILAFIICVRLCVDVTFSQSVIVDVENGALKGDIRPLGDNKEYYNFQGIPYALPPVGELRFRDPVPYKQWNGTLDATKVKPSCPEVQVTKSIYTVIGNENCLYLNVFTSQNPQKIEQYLPVMVWFYGGSFREGNSTLYGPEFLLKNEVIVVTLNYRLSIFGFLATDDLNSPGNYGLKDQVEALRWIKRNIRRFGGDPGKVTIFGESAGAAAVGFLLISNQTEGLFSGAIMQSGSPLCNWALDRNPRKIAFDLGAAFGITTNSTRILMDFLRQKNLLKHPNILIKLYKVNTPDSVTKGGPLGPVIEPNYPGALITKDSLRAFMAGDFMKVPIIMGVNSQEAKFLAAELESSKLFYILFDISPSLLIRDPVNAKSPKDRGLAGRRVIEHYFKSKSFILGSMSEVTEFFTDDLFVRPITKTAVLMSNFVPVYFYVYDYEGSLGKWWLKFKSIYNPEIKGVGHATDLFYLWNMTLGSPEFNNDEERLVSQRLTKLWTNFAKYSNPTPDPDKLLQNIEWPQFNKETTRHLHISSSLQISQNFRNQHFEFWEKIFKKYSNGPYLIY